jgi:hypothetical protein
MIGADWRTLETDVEKRTNKRRKRPQSTEARKQRKGYGNLRRK